MAKVLREPHPPAPSPVPGEGVTGGYGGGKVLQEDGIYAVRTAGVLVLGEAHTTPSQSVTDGEGVTGTPSPPYLCNTVLQSEGKRV
jgi:hypothetical protein